jgi:hypothetical protein
MQITPRNARPVVAACGQCSEPFSQPWGAVTSAICQLCRKAAAQAFWAQAEASPPPSAAQLAEMTSALLRLAFEGKA